MEIQGYRKRPQAFSPAGIIWRRKEQVIFLVIQHPLIDVRPLIKNDKDDKVIAPDKYLMSFGMRGLRRNVDKSVPNSERQFFNAKRAIRFRSKELETGGLEKITIQPQPGYAVRPDIVFRRFFSDKHISHLDIGFDFIHNAHSPTQALAHNKIPIFLGKVMQIPVAIPTKLTEPHLLREARGVHKEDGATKPLPKREFVFSDIAKAGGHLANLYYNATMDSKRLSDARNQQLVFAGSPQIFWEYDEGELEAIPSYFVQIDCEHNLCVHYANVIVGPTQQYETWLIKKDKAQKDKIQNLRICLSYMHHEQEWLSFVIDWYRNNKDRYSLDEKRLVALFDSYARRLVNPSFGFDKKRILESAYNYCLVISLDDYNFILGMSNMNSFVQREICKILENNKGGITVKINNGVIVEGDNTGEIFVLHGDVKDSFNNSFNKTLKEAPEPKTDSADKIEALKKELENIRDGINP